MITQEMVDRINELYKKSKAEGLTREEAREQAKLRSLYLDAIRTNIRSNLDTIKIQQPDDTLIDVKKRHEEKMKKMNENMNN